MSVSIHAPARGATLENERNDYSRVRFNPRARTGRDYPPLCQRQSSERFNPRARTGRDSLSVTH